MKFGLEIFDIEPMSYPEVSLVEKEITQLTEIWNIKHEWDKQCGVWKDIKFYDLDIEDMLDVSMDFALKYKALDKEVRDWHVFMFLKNDIEKFTKTLPLI